MATTVSTFDSLISKAVSGAITTIDRNMEMLRVTSFENVSIKTNKDGSNRRLMIDGVSAVKASTETLRKALSITNKAVEKAREKNLIRKGRPTVEEATGEANRIVKGKAKAQKQEVAQEA